MLTDDQILDIAATQQLSNHALPAIKFARAIEAEVRKDHDALIRQMLEALEYHTMQTRPITKTDKVMAAARSRLEKAP